GAYVEGLQNHSPDSNSTRSIGLIQYAPNKLVYKTSCEQDEFVVFSEMWYGPNKGWTAYIDGQEVSQDGFNHIRVNYILRGMKIPAGEHEIIFEFKPQSFEFGEKVSFASSAIILLLIAGWLFKEFKAIKS
ncbi:MAG: putative membrane protein YfhO, partial [Bacteroidia bacterium]